jgi:hypothetical protein
MAQVAVEGGVRSYFIETTFRGEVVDSVTGAPLPYAVLSVVKEIRDGRLAVQNHGTDSLGRFSFKVAAGALSRVEVSHVGYKLTVVALDADRPVVNLGKIRLAEDILQVDEVIVRSRARMYQVRGDTITYFPAAARQMRGDALLDILRQMPGVSVGSDGQVTILGQPVERTYIDGRLLFGTDPRVAVTNLDANDVAAIHSYKEPDEDEQLLYGKNARSRRVINVATFSRFTRSISGSARGEAGADEARRERYQAEMQASHYNEQQQLALKVSTDNRPLYDQLFGRQAEGEKRRQEFSVNAAALVGENDYSSEYRHVNVHATSSNFELRDFFPSTAFRSRISADSASSGSTDKAHTGRVDYKRRGNDNKYRIHFSSFFLSNSRAGEEDRVSTVVQDGRPVTESRNRRASFDKSSTFHLVPVLYKKMNDGSSMSFSSNLDINDAGNTATRADSTRAGGVVTRALTGLRGNRSHIDLSSQLTYNRTRRGTLSLTGDINWNGRRDATDATNELTGTRDSTRSRDYTTDHLSINAHVSYRITHKKHRAYASVGYAHVAITSREAFPVAFTDRYRDRLPELSLSYGYDFSGTARASVNFTKRNITPNLLWRNDRVDDTNPLSIRVGNPRLKPSTHNALTLSGSLLKGGHTFRGDLLITLHANAPVYTYRYFTAPATLPGHGDYRVPAGATVTSFENVERLIDFRAIGMYATRVSPLRSTIDVTVDYARSTPREKIDDAWVHSTNQESLLKVKVNTDLSTTFRSSVTSTTRYRHFKNYLGHVQREVRESVNADIRWDFWDLAYLTAIYVMEYNHGTRSAATLDNHLLNLSLGYRLFEEGRGSVSINAYDLLNRAEYITTRVDNLQVSTAWQHLPARYFTVAFVYAFKNKR